jgi:hypothetical protein
VRKLDFKGVVEEVEEMVGEIEASVRDLKLF